MITYGKCICPNPEESYFNIVLILCLTFLIWWFCPKCGTQNEISDGEAICQKCGYCQQFDAKTRFFIDIFQKISEMPKEENNT